MYGVIVWRAGLGCTSAAYILGSITPFGKEILNPTNTLGDHGSQKAAKVAPTVLCSRGQSMLANCIRYNTL